MSSFLYINPIWENIDYFVFDAKKNIQEHHTIISNDISISFPQKIAELSKKYTLSEVWCIEGPGPFTKMRIVILCLNTLKYIYPTIHLKWCHFFDLIWQISSKIPLLKANRKEFLIQENGSSIFYQKENLPKYEYIWYIWNEDSIDTFTKYKDSVDTVFTVFESLENKSRFSPIYIKKPHITCPKK